VRCGRLLHLHQVLVEKRAVDPARLEHARGPSDVVREGSRRVALVRAAQKLDVKTHVRDAPDPRQVSIASHPIGVSGQKGAGDGFRNQRLGPAQRADDVRIFRDHETNDPAILVS
jgi:hypothetical protein